MVFLRPFIVAVAVGSLIVVSSVRAGAGGPTTKVDFAKSVRPLLKRNCYGCHSSGSASGGLELDSKQGILRGGESGKLLKPGQGSQSLLVRRLKGIGGTRMPKIGDPLTAAQISLIQRWIDQGAKM